MDGGFRVGKLKCMSVAGSHPEVVKMQQVYPAARSDLSSLLERCAGTEKADMIAVITSVERPHTPVLIVNLWVKDESENALLLNIWGILLRIYSRPV